MKIISMPLKQYEQELAKLRASVNSSSYRQGVFSAISVLRGELFGVRRQDLFDEDELMSALLKLVMISVRIQLVKVYIGFLMRISHSALSTFQECGKKYFLHYMLRLRPKGKKSALAFGDSIDIGLNCLLETRNLAEALIKFEDSWKKYQDQGVVYSKSDLDEHLFIEGETASVHESLRRRGRILLEEYNEQVMPQLEEVIAVQVERLVPNDLMDELVIKTDFIAKYNGKIILFDNKTTSVRYAEDSVRTSSQLAIYYEMLKEEYKIDACGYVVVPKKINKKKLPRIKIEIIIDSIDDEMVEMTLEQYDKGLAEIKNAQFELNHKSCMSKYGPCPYLEYCRKGSLNGLEYV